MSQCLENNEGRYFEFYAFVCTVMWLCLTLLSHAEPLFCRLVQSAGVKQRTLLLGVGIRYQNYSKMHPKIFFQMLYHLLWTDNPWCLGMQTCSDCGKDLKLCPFCQREISTRIRLYWRPSEAMYNHHFKHTFDMIKERFEIQYTVNTGS